MQYISKVGQVSISEAHKLYNFDITFKSSLCIGYAIPLQYIFQLI